MRSVCGFCDYFVIASGNSLRQVNAIAKAIEEDLSRPSAKSDQRGRDFNIRGIKPLSEVPGNDESGWIVLDYSSVVVHIFHKPVREFYSLERLWNDAKRVRIPRLSLRS